jgi:LuxR family transcriptional regulator, quorum-sensing system regulator CciR
MSQLSEVQTFVRQANRLSKTDDLKSLLEDVVRSLGFDYFALAHHVDLKLPPADAVRLDNYPTAWVEMIMAHRYYVDDPVLAASQKTAAGFVWSEVPSFMPLTPRQKEILERAAREGMGDGFTVPVHVPGEFFGSCSFGVRFGRELPEASLPAAQYVGCFAFEAARRVARLEAARRRRLQAEDRPILSQRQRDCVTLVAMGRSDKEAARALGISPDTVHQHIEEAKRRYGVEKRNQLLVRALFEGDIAFSDVIDPLP